MSVTNTDPIVNLVGNGSTVTQYPYNREFIAVTDIVIYVTLAGVRVATLTHGSGCMVVKNSSPTVGGYFTTSVAWSSSYVLTVTRATPLTQTASFGPSGNLPSTGINAVNDKTTLLVQDLAAMVRKSFRLPAYVSDIQAVNAVANGFLALDATGTPVFYRPDQIVTILNLQSYYGQIFGQGLRTWLNAAARALVIPDYVGQIGVQQSDNTIWISSGITVGSWTAGTPGIPDASITAAKLVPGILSVDSAGRALMADGFFTADTTGRAKFASKFVTFDKIQDISTGVLLGRYDAGSGSIEPVTIGSGLSLSAGGVMTATGTGSVLQVVSTTVSARTTITGTIPADGTIPQNTEGTQLISATITPRSSSNKIIAFFVGWGLAAASGGGSLAIALFRGSAPDAVAATYINPFNNGNYIWFGLNAPDLPATTSAVTYAIRLGTGTGSAFYVNGDSSSAVMGNGIASLILMEVLP